MFGLLIFVRHVSSFVALQMSSLVARESNC